MILLVASRADPASALLAETLVASHEFGAPRRVGGASVRDGPPFVLAEIDGMHLEADALDRAIDRDVESVLVLSKHRSEAGTPALTVHMIGNWGAEAKYGGRPRTVVPPAAHLAAAILRRLADSPPAGYAVTYEATHHGPLLSKPTAYVELGSGPAQWGDATAAAAIVRAVLAAPGEGTGGPVLLGVGGGHYAPRFTDLARRGNAVFGHILPGYALSDVTDETLAAAAQGHDGFVVDRRGSPAGLDRVVSTLARWLPQKELSV